MSTAVTAAPDHHTTAMPPHDLTAEQSVLGGMMLAADAIGEVTETMTGTDFYRPAHQVIYQVICDLYTAGDPTDPVAVSAELDRNGDLRRVGGAPYLHTLMQTVPTAANAGYYAEIVAAKAILRRLIEAGTRIVQMGHQCAAGGAQIDEVVNRAQAALDTATGNLAANAGYTLLADMTTTQLAALHDIQAGRVQPGLATGYTDLDTVTGGLKPGQLIVIAGRPGLGKSTVALDIARTTALRHGHTTAIFSLEMAATELWHRIVAAEARVQLHHLTTPHALTPTDHDRITHALDRITHAAPLIIDDTPNTTPTQIRATARRIKARHGLALIVVDYIQLMTTTNRRTENRQVEVSEFSRQLKILAKELDTPVIALSQLNRGPEQRHDKRPLLSDLRESGALEQDADLVALLHRPELYEPDSPRAGEADLILAKHRNGPTTTITLAQQLHYARFTNCAAPD